MPRRAGIGGLGHGLGVQGNMPGRQAAQVLQPRQQPLCGRETITRALVTQAPWQERAHDVGERMAAQHREKMVEQSKLFKVAPRAAPFGPLPASAPLLAGARGAR